MYKLLIIEDDFDLCEILNIYLKKVGYYTVTVHNSKDALNALNNQAIDLILMDVMLPDMQGIDASAEIRKKLFCPIIFMSAISDEKYIIKALKAGGDDYVTKPINYPQLLARIESNLRRVNIYSKIPSEDKTLIFENFSIDFGRHIVLKDGKPINISPIEYGILIYMVQHPNTVLSYNDIFNNVWVQDSLGDIRTVMVHVSNLRKKLYPSQLVTNHIRTVRGIGYMFSA